MNKILIVGANSYIGNAFEKHTMNKCSSHKEMLTKDEILIEKVHASNGDWKNINYELYDVVIIVAAIVHQKEKSGMEELYRQVNYNMPIEIATKAKKAGVKQLIYMSTAAVYGSVVTHITKDTEPNPDTLYGKSKLEAEYKLREMETEEFRVAIIRPPMVYGEGCKGNYTRLVKLATYNPIYPRIHNKRSMIHIENLCNYMEEIIQNSSSGLFLPQDESYVDTIIMIKSIREKEGKRTVIIPGTAWLVKLVMKRVGVVRKMFGDWYYE